MSDLRFAKGTLDVDEFERAAKKFNRIAPHNLAVARAFLVKPGQFQVVIAQEHNMSPQLVNKQCKRIYDAHRAIVEATKGKE